MINESKLTLRQGLEQFRRANESYLSHSEKNVSREARTFFESHDVAHVVFGCDISLFGEGALKVWTIFGTTLGFWQQIRAYRQADAFGLAQNFSIPYYVDNILRFLAALPMLIIRAKRMSRPWPWSGFESYLDTPIVEIRRAFNIQVR